MAVFDGREAVCAIAGADEAARRLTVIRNGLVKLFRAGKHSSL